MYSIVLCYLDIVEVAYQVKNVVKVVLYYTVVLLRALKNKKNANDRMIWSATVYMFLCH